MPVVESEIGCIAFLKERFSCFMIRKTHPASGFAVGRWCVTGPSV